MERKLGSLEELRNRSDDIYDTFGNGEDWIGVLQSLLDPAGALEARGWTLAPDLRERLGRRALHLHDARARSSLRLERQAVGERRARRSSPARPSWLGVGLRRPGDGPREAPLLDTRDWERRDRDFTMAFHVDGERAEATAKALWGRALGPVGGLPRCVTLARGGKVWLDEPRLERQQPGRQLIVTADVRVEQRGGAVPGTARLSVPLVRLGSRETAFTAIAGDLRELSLELTAGGRGRLPAGATAELQRALRADAVRFLLFTPPFEALDSLFSAERSEVVGEAWCRVDGGRFWLAVSPRNAGAPDPAEPPQPAQARLDLPPGFLAQSLSALVGRRLPRCLTKEGALLATAPPADLDPSDACPVVVKGALFLPLPAGLFFFKTTLAMEDWYTLGADIDLEVSVSVALRTTPQGRIFCWVARKDEIDIPWVADLFWWLTFTVASILVDLLTGGVGGSLVEKGGALFRAKERGRIREEGGRLLDAICGSVRSSLGEREGNVVGELGRAVNVPLGLLSGAVAVSDPEAGVMEFDVSPPMGVALGDTPLLLGASYQILRFDNDGARMALPMRLGVRAWERSSTLTVASQERPIKVASSEKLGNDSHVELVRPSGAEVLEEAQQASYKTVVDRWAVTLRPSWSDTARGGARQGPTRFTWTVDGRTWTTWDDEAIDLEVDTRAGDVALDVRLEARDVFDRIWSATRALVLLRTVVSGPDWHRMFEDVIKKVEYKEPILDEPFGPIGGHGPPVGPGDPFGRVG